MGSEIVLLRWQQEVFISDARHRIVVGGRRIGMSTLALAEATQTIVRREQPVCLLPNYRMSNGFLEAGVPVYWPYSDDIDDLAPDLLIVDGLSCIEEMAKVAMLISRSQRVLLMGTPLHPRLGQVDWLRFFYQMAEHQSDWARWRIPTTELVNNTLDIETLAQIRRELPTHVAASEFDAQWIDPAV